ncbi:hypothetical protein M0R45_005414 [Rubus argutus]|uniref:Uncharacterized protein n=1 Tax=Rubus argutus TaxID=59490 RepID=A0AAW1YMS9_RUBAR
MEVGSKTTVGSDKGSLPRRHSASDLLDGREGRIETSSNNRFLSKYGQSLGSKLNPILYTGRKSRTDSDGAKISVKKKSVLRKKDEDAAEELEPDNSIGKEEGDWNSTTADLVDTLDEDETELLSSRLGENESQYSADESNNGDEEFSSLECESDNDPLEDTNFKLENFLKGMPFSNSSVIQGIEEPMEKSLGLLQPEKLSEKEVEVPKDEEVEDHARNKFKAAAKQYRRRGGTCSSSRNTHHAQKFRKNLQLVGKLGKFLAPMKMELIPLNVYRRRN